MNSILFFDGGKRLRAILFVVPIGAERTTLGITHPLLELRSVGVEEFGISVPEIYVLRCHKDALNRSDCG